MLVVVLVVAVVAVVAMGRRFEEEAFGRQSVGQGAESHSTGTQAESIGFGKARTFPFRYFFRGYPSKVIVNFQT